MPTALQDFPERNRRRFRRILWIFFAEFVQLAQSFFTFDQALFDFLPRDADFFAAWLAVAFNNSSASPTSVSKSLTSLLCCWFRRP